MRKRFLSLVFSTLSLTCFLHFPAHAAPAGPLIRHLSSLLRWTTRIPTKTPYSDANVVQFEDGYLVETIVEGNELGFVPHQIRVSDEGELYAVDAVNSNIVRITPPLSQYSRGRLVAGSFQGYTGHVDGKSIDARFNHPKGVTMDDKGNVYVADTLNLAIRKIGEGGVTTIAGGKSNIAGYRDGPSESAMFSTDFDVIYLRPTCSLLVVDRGNAALRQISLNQEDCDYQYTSISDIDIFMVIGAIVVGYASCILQQGLPSFLSKMNHARSASKSQPSKEKPNPKVETVKDEQEAVWPSFGQLIIDLSKLALEALGSAFFYFTPFNLKTKNSNSNLTPLRDSLIMPEDEPEAPTIQKQRTQTPISETRQTHVPNTGEKYSEMKPSKLRSGIKDPSLSKHRSLKRHEYAEYYGSGEAPNYGQHRSKTQKERGKHRMREKSGETGFGLEQKPVEMKNSNYDEAKFEHYNMRSKYGDSFRF